MGIQTNEHKNIWNNYLDLFQEKLKKYKIKSFDSNYSAVIMETREHKHLEVVIKNFMYFLNESNSDIKWKLEIFHGNENKEFVYNLVSGIDNVELHHIDYPSTITIDDYSTTLTSSSFWNTITSDNILIFQTDTILLRNGIDKFLEYSYVGAPWIKPKEEKFIGNGGLSFRKKQKMLEIINKHSSELIDNMYNEDIFFCKYLKDNDVPSLELCKEFAVEDIYCKNPLGLHQPKIEPKKLKKILNELL